MEFPGTLISLLLWYNATWLFLWFYQKLIHFQCENSEKAKKFFAAKSKQRFFSFPSSHCFFFFQSWRVLYKNQSTRPKRPAAQNARNALLTLFATLKQWLFAAKMYLIKGKKVSMHLSRYEESIAYKQIFRNFPTLCAIMHFFQNYVNYVLRAELCDFASVPSDK